MTSSAGQQLFHKIGLRQGAYFNASIISVRERKQWIQSRSQHALRIYEKNNTIPDDALIVVTSQDCDISCSNDDIDKCIELAIFKKIKKKKAYPGNQFVKSVRKLQIHLGAQWYEAKVEYIVEVEKGQLLELLTDPNDIQNLPEVHNKSIPVWRANRYLRTALPDEFNQKLYPVFDSHLPALENATKREDDTSYIRALYLWLDTFDEVEQYTFEIFALLAEDTPDEILSEAQDVVEEMSESLTQNDYFESDDSIYADRDSSTYVSYLTRFVRINLDHESLAEGDDEVGPDL